MKLWQKKAKLNSEIEKFTVGNDYLLDQELVNWDVIGSIAHSKMLAKIKILKPGEQKKLQTELKKILKYNESNKFKIKPSDEDVHTAVENKLTKKLGELGKKIHTARSRNDQVLLDTRLYTKEKLLEIYEITLDLIQEMLKFSKKHENIPMPGYTHMQKAMPSSVALFVESFAESLFNDVWLLKMAYDLNNQCPLGSGAGYGVSIPIDRKYVSDLLDFGTVQNNVLFVQNSRGKIESVVLFVLSQIMQDLAKFSNDLIMFSMPEFGYFSLPDEFCTGSSIMPQKKNPDVLELVRAKSSVMNAYLTQVQGICAGLHSGYNRDLQLTKEPLIKGLQLAENSLQIIGLVLGGLKVNKQECLNACNVELFATDKAYTLVKKGKAFRDAYKEVAKELEHGLLDEFDPVENIKKKKHIGATGNLNIAQFQNYVKQEKKILLKEKKSFEAKIGKLLK